MAYERHLGKRFGVFVAGADLQVFSGFLQHVFTEKRQAHCEVVLELHGRPSITVQIEASLSANERECRAVVLDITERQHVRGGRGNLGEIGRPVDNASAASVEQDIVE